MKVEILKVWDALLMGIGLTLGYKLTLFLLGLCGGAGAGAK